jgi:hypothetical protein
MKVGLLTETEKNLLVGVEYEPSCFFYPLQDGNTPPNWVISEEEMYGNINESVEWVKNLPLIDWVSPPYEPDEEGV